MDERAAEPRGRDSDRVFVPRACSRCSGGAHICTAAAVEQKPGRFEAQRRRVRESHGWRRAVTHQQTWDALILKGTGGGKEKHCFPNCRSPEGEGGGVGESGGRWQRSKPAESSLYTHFLPTGESWKPTVRRCCGFAIFPSALLRPCSSL